jgi:hypothetical protein
MLTSTRKFVGSQPDVLRDLAEQRRGDVATFMHGDSGSTAIRVTILYMRTALSHSHESQGFEAATHFDGLEDRQRSHELLYRDTLSAEEFGFELRLAILEQHLDDLV